MEYHIALFTRAINHKLIMRIYYDPGWRDIEPHALGRSSQRDFLLRAYQVSGASASNERTDWKLFRVDRIGSIEPEAASFFAPREGYKRGDPAMRGGIIVQL